MNAGLGNQDSFRSADAVTVDSGHVLFCPLCSDGPNNELYLVRGCIALLECRSNIMLGRLSLKGTVTSIRLQNASKSDEETFCLFLGQE